MTDEIRIPVNAKIPKSLHDSILAAVEAEQYKDKTACITEALEKLLHNTQEEAQDDTEILQEMENELQKLQSEIRANYTTIQSKDTELQNYKTVLQNKESEIHRLQSVIRDAPDPLELARLQERNEGLNLVIAEKDKRIEDLTREVSRLDMFAHYFKTTEVKQIEAPATAEKKKAWYKFW